VTKLRIKAVAASALAGSFLLALALSCGEALGPEPPAWVTRATFPEGTGQIGGLAADSLRGYVYAAAGGKGSSVIWRYDGRGFSEDYAPPYEYGEAWLTDIAYAGSVGWAAGGKVAGGEDSPYLIRNFSRSEWLEVPLATNTRGSISAVQPANDHVCWFTVCDDYIRVINRRRGTLARYRDGEVEVYPDLGEVTCAVSSAGGGRSGGYVVFAAEAVAGGTRVGDSRVFVSADGGASWADERLEFHSPVGEAMAEVRAECALGTDLYLFVDFANGYNGVVKRTGPPGQGEYELVFYATEGSNFKWLNDVVVADGNIHHARGMAVGYDTSVVYDGPGWKIEEVAYPANIEYVAPSADGGFWAAAEDLTSGRSELFYHR
jgi:hypothetical protein